jgi:hypothetical protein
VDYEARFSYFYVCFREFVGPIKSSPGREQEICSNISILGSRALFSGRGKDVVPQKTKVCWRDTESITQRSIKSTVSEHKRVIYMAMWVHSSVVRAADCRSAGPWFKSGCALLLASNCGTWSIHRHQRALPSHPGPATKSLTHLRPKRARSLTHLRPKQASPFLDTPPFAPGPARFRHQVFNTPPAQTGRPLPRHASLRTRAGPFPPPGL